MKKIRYNKFKNLIVYGGLNQEEYKNAKRYRDSSNLKLWRIIAIVLVVLFSALTIYYCLEPTQSYFIIIDAAMTVYSAVMSFILIFKAKDYHTVLINFFMEASLLLLLGYGLILGLQSKSELTVSFIVILVALPLLVVDKPYITILIVAAAIVGGIVSVNLLKAPSIAMTDTINLISFGFVSIVLHLYTVDNRMQGFLSLYKVEHAAHIDALTGLESELSYVEMVADINEHIKNNNQEKFSLMMCDLNGLKAIDDTYGHLYGCQVVVEAGHFLAYMFKNSRSFHVGGDEYIVCLIGDDLENKEELVKKFEEAMDDYFIERDGIKLRVSLAYGVSVYQKGKDKMFQDVLNRADARMYENKKIVKEKYHIASRKE